MVTVVQGQVRLGKMRGVVAPISSRADSAVSPQVQLCWGGGGLKGSLIKTVEESDSFTT